jgi:dolichyl-phosphate-mannose--protein O-mannosyl transferase
MAKMLSATAGTFILALPLLEYVKTSLWGNPINRILYMLISVSQNTNYTTAIGTPSAPWEWLIKPDLEFIFSAARAPHYFVTIGWTIWSLIIISIAFLGFKAIRSWKHSSDIFTFTLAWFLSIFGSLVLIELYSNRPMFNYYLYPAIPAVCIAIALLLWEIWQSMQRRESTKRLFVISLSAYLVVTLVCFIIMSPLGPF